MTSPALDERQVRAFAAVPSPCGWRAAAWRPAVVGSSEHNVGVSKKSGVPHIDLRQ